MNPNENGDVFFIDATELSSRVFSVKGAAVGSGESGQFERATLTMSLVSPDGSVLAPDTNYATDMILIAAGEGKFCWHCQI